MSTRSYLRRQPRGGAAVETAVLMIALIPLIMYQFFLSDLLQYRLNQDEAVYSAAWDFLSYDYRHLDKDIMVGEANSDTPTAPDLVSWTSLNVRQTYYDHSSAYNNYGSPSTDADSLKHHQALAAHECWLANRGGDPAVGRGEQVTCWNDEPGGILNGAGIADRIFRLMPRGGLYACRARLGVQNYFLPTKFLNFGKVKMSPDLATGGQMKRYTAGSDVHANAGGDPYMFPEGRFAVLHDPWAFNYVKTSLVINYPRDRTSGHTSINPEMHPLNLAPNMDEFTRWMMVPFGLYATASLRTAQNDFLDELANRDFVDTAIGRDGAPISGGDAIYTPPVAWHPAKDHRYSDQFPSGWRDSRSSGMVNQNQYMRRATNSW
jgi:hypothetical protein